MNQPLDYERFGRQIALAELGVHGQLALAARPVRFLCAHSECARDAERIWTRAGGAIAADATDATAPDALTVEIPVVPAMDAVASLALAAWAALEAAHWLLHGRASQRPAALDLALALSHP
ncbi:MAG: hypothetical protein U0269_25590 [Polyangiales bacterium]